MNLILANGGVFITTYYTRLPNNNIEITDNPGDKIPIKFLPFDSYVNFVNGLNNAINSATMGNSEDVKSYQIGYYDRFDVMRKFSIIDNYIRNNLKSDEYVKFSNGSILFSIRSDRDSTLSIFILSPNYLVYSNNTNVPPIKFRLFSTITSYITSDSLYLYVSGDKVEVLTIHNPIVTSQFNSTTSISDFVESSWTSQIERSASYLGYYITQQEWVDVCYSKPIDKLFKHYLDSGADIENDDPWGGSGITPSQGGVNPQDGEKPDKNIPHDPIPIPTLPILKAVDAGFITLFRPTLVELKSLASYMWSDFFDVDTFKKIFANPMDCIMGLSILPVTPESAGQAEVKVGNISTGVTMTKSADQYVEVDCGTIDLKEYFGGYLDYSPYTKIQVFLPYIGFRDIDIDNVMRSKITIKYHVDVISGGCVAFIQILSSQLDSVMYSFNGQCSVQLPITGKDYTDCIRNIISAVATVGTAVATGGASLALPPGLKGQDKIDYAEGQAKSRFASNAIDSGAGLLNNVMGMKANIERGGTFSSTNGLMSIQKPYLIFQRPNICVPVNQNHYTGYPSFVTKRIGDLKGFTIMNSFHLDGVQASDIELSEIESLLKEGVIL